jgi:uncharacterized protein YebE (UPF0316 family)
MMSPSAFLAAVPMAAAALVSVGLWTLRVALTARGRKLAGATVAALEASVFVVVFGSLVTDLNQPVRLGGYAVGVAVGTLLGITADKHLAQGRSEVRIVVKGSETSLVKELQAGGWASTAMGASGLQGPVTLVSIVVDDSCVAALLDDVRRLAPDAFWTVGRIDHTKPAEHAPTACRLAVERVGHDVPTGQSPMVNR